MWLSCLASGLGVAGLCWGYRAAQGSTLRAPLVWSGVSWLSLLIAFGGAADEATAGAESLRYAAAVSTLCPGMALLGAKRPQNGGWQWIVATLWLILLLPAGQRWAFSPTAELLLHPAWRWFLTLLVLIEVANYLPTRHGWAAAGVGLGQIVLLGAQGPAPWELTPLIRLNWALVLFALAVVGTGWSEHRRPLANGWNRVWLDFRNRYGVVWALRVQERINQAARPEPTGLTLAWTGWLQALQDDTRHASALEFSGRLPVTLETGVRTTLRRFVSSAWIDERLGGEPTEEQRSPSPPLEPRSSEEPPAQPARPNSTAPW